MDGQLANLQASTVAMLRRLAVPRVAKEQCDLCKVEIAPAHRHLLKVIERKIICACDPCAIRFQDVVGGRFKLIPRDARALRDFRMTDAQWEGFALPINLAFFHYDSANAKVTALYPSPAGATESLLSFENWKDLVEENPVLAALEPDVEALLVNRAGGSREYFIAPIDRCFGLVGLIRTHWRGLSGGDAVWNEIEKFFANLSEQTGLESEAQEAGHA